MDIYEYFKAQSVKIKSSSEMFTGNYECYLYQGREGEEPLLMIAPHQGCSSKFIPLPFNVIFAIDRKRSIK